MFKWWATYTFSFHNLSSIVHIYVCTISYIFDIVWTNYISHKKFFSKQSKHYTYTTSTTITSKYAIILFIFSTQSIIFYAFCFSFIRSTIFSAISWHSLLILCKYSFNLPSNKSTYNTHVWTLSDTHISYNQTFRYYYLFTPVTVNPDINFIFCQHISNINLYNNILWLFYRLLQTLWFQHILSKLITIKNM